MAEINSQEQSPTIDARNNELLGISEGGQTRNPYNTVSDSDTSMHSGSVSPSHSDASQNSSISADAKRSHREGIGEVASIVSNLSETTLVATKSHEASSNDDIRQRSQSASYPSTNRSSTLLPWGVPKERWTNANMAYVNMDIRPGEFVMRTLFAEFTVHTDRKMEAVMTEPLEKPLSKILQRGEDAQFDQLLSAFGSVAEHCLPSLLRALFAWYERQMIEGSIVEAKGKVDQKNKSIIHIVSGSSAPETIERSEADLQQERRDLAVEFIFCLVLIEVLKQLPFHPGHENLVNHIENIAFKHFKYRECIQSGLNAANIHIIADLYAEVIGVLAQSRFMSVRKRFMTELKELRSKEPSTQTTQSIISLLMGMKFFRVKMVPIEEFEASFQFMQETAQYFLEVKEKDIKHALAGLFVEILVPVAATVKNEVNVPCLKNFVEMLYSQTLDACTKSKHRLALFPLVTCLLCVSQKSFFLQNWHYFLAMCLGNLKNRDAKLCRVALESLYRLLWVYMIRIKCESNSATQSRLQSIVHSLFPKGSKAVVPRDTPLNIFVKIIQFIAQERLDFAMSEIVFDLLSVGRPIKMILTPERMSIGLRAFLVVADSLQQKEGEPPMPRTVGVLPSGNTLRVKKTFLNKMLTEDTARTIGMSTYFPHVKRVFVDILRALDVHYGRPLMMTNTQNLNKEPDEMITGERKPRIDLFRTCVAAVPRLIPDGMSGPELVELLSRLTVHMDEELRGLAYQSLQTLVIDFPYWRYDVVWGFTQFLARDIPDTFPNLIDNGLRMLLQLLTSWKNALNIFGRTAAFINLNTSQMGKETNPNDQPISNVLHFVEALALVMLCNNCLNSRRLAVHILREAKQLLKLTNGMNINSIDQNIKNAEEAVMDVIDRCCPAIIEQVIPILPTNEKTAALAMSNNIDLQWIADRTSSAWTTGCDDINNLRQSPSPTNFNLAPWSVCLFGFLENDRVLSQCPSATAHSWPIIFTRINLLFPVIDPTPVSDNRASLLRSSVTIRKPANERDLYLQVWRNYITFACRVIPPVPSPVIRCASPDLSLRSCESDSSMTACSEPNQSVTSNVSFNASSLSDNIQMYHSWRPLDSLEFVLTYINRSSPDSMSTDRNEQKATNASPTAFYKLIVPLIRCEVADVRDSVVFALGRINHEALKDLMEDLLIYIREAVDRKQENVRRRRRRDALRLQLIRVFELIAEYGTLGVNGAGVLERENQSLHQTFVEYMDGARVFLECEQDKDVPAVKQIILHFSNFIWKMIKNFQLSARTTLLKSELSRNLFSLFNSYSGPYAVPTKLLHENDLTSLNSNASVNQLNDSNVGVDTFQFSALQAMSALLCCGSCFNPLGLLEDGVFYPWLDLLLMSNKEKVYNLGKETVILLLECNPDMNVLLDWVIDRCYTGSPQVADGCFLALATIFSAREYPCDHYTSVINVTLMNTGCPRTLIHDTAVYLLQILDKRFFDNEHTFSMHTVPVDEQREANRNANVKDNLNMMDVPNANMEFKDPISNNCRSQMFFSKQWAQLHPSLTMPMFSDITHRFQTARSEVRQLLLCYLLPWLNNIELVDPNVPPGNPLSIYYQDDTGARRSEGCGSVEATEMVLNNLFYITAKFSDQHQRDVEEVWATLCSSWLNNLKVIIRYLIIITGMAPQELLLYTKRVVLFLARSQPERLLDEMMMELQTVETLNCLIERTETPPFYRLTSMRKASSHSDGGSCNNGTNGTNPTCEFSSSRAELTVEKGTIHTKRHSGEDPIKNNRAGTSTMSEGLRGIFDLNPGKIGTISTNGTVSAGDYGNIGKLENMDENIPRLDSENDKAVNISVIRSHPHPLPMPEYGGYFAPLTEYLPDSSLPIASFHRCNVAVMLICDVLTDGVTDLDWSIHLPLLLHIVFLGMDNTRTLVHEHCRRLLLNLLVVVANHSDYLFISQILLNSHTDSLKLGLTTPQLPVKSHTFTEIDTEFDAYLNGLTINRIRTETALSAESSTTTVNTCMVSNSETMVDMSDIKHQAICAETIVHTNNAVVENEHLKQVIAIDDVIKSLVHFLGTRTTALWSYEDITAKVWSVKSAEQLDIFLQHILRVFRESLPHALINERWAQTALQLGLSCSSRHYAGRSLQVFRSLRLPITSRMLSEILSRLVETVAEQGEDMQGYVTELLLTLEAAVDSLESDFRPLDFMKEIFKSTPNLNKDLSTRKTAAALVGAVGRDLSQLNHPTGHTRSTSYSVSYCMRKSMHGTHAHEKETRRPTTNVGLCGSIHQADSDSGRSVASGNLNKITSNLSRSRSAQSLKLLGDQTSQDDKMTILAQLFWLSVSLLESDYEHEFLLAVRLLSKVMHRLPLNRPDARDKVDKLQQQLKWQQFPGVHALLLKGCTHPNVYEPVVAILSDFTLFLDLPVVDATESVGFPMNVIALLPYLLLNYEETNELCIRAADNIAQASTEKSKKLENLGTVMTLYSRRNFSKESFQWTKCVVKYLNDTYSHLSINMLTFLVEVLEKGPLSTQSAILNIIHCMLHYVDLSSATSQVANEILRVIAKYLESTHWREALKILKLVVTRASALVAPPIAIHTSNLMTQPPSYHREVSSLSCDFNRAYPTTFNDVDFSMVTKKELPGRTMEFTFDLSQTPVIGRRFLIKQLEDKNNASQSTSTTMASSTTGTSASHSSTTNSGNLSTLNVNDPHHINVASPRRSMSLSPGDAALLSGWKRPWMSQARVRECLINLLTACGQRVGLPKSPSVIFSQSSDLIERQSSMASSTEEVSGTNNDLSGGSRRDDAATEQFGVFKDFDFLEYESESVEGESTDNFNWGVRRLPLSEGESRSSNILVNDDSVSEQTQILSKRSAMSQSSGTNTSILLGAGNVSIPTSVANTSMPLDESSDDEIGSESPLDDLPNAPDFGTNQSFAHCKWRGSGRSDTSSSNGDVGDVTPCNASPNFSTLIGFRPEAVREEEAWRNKIMQYIDFKKANVSTMQMYHQLYRLVKDVETKTMFISREACRYLTLNHNNTAALIGTRLMNVTEVMMTSLHPQLIWFDADNLRNECATEAMRFGVLEVREHLETFFDRKDHATETLEAVRAAFKLYSISSVGAFDAGHDELLLDVGRAVYKLIFQLLLLFETIQKMVSRLIATIKDSAFQDLSNEINNVRAALKRATDEDACVDDDALVMCTPDLLAGTSNNQLRVEQSLRELIAENKWASALALIRRHRFLWLNDLWYDSTRCSDTLSIDEDVSIAVNVYCKTLIATSNGIWLVSEGETDLAEIFTRLYQVSSVIQQMETTLKERDQHEPVYTSRALSQHSEVDNNEIMML